MGPDLRQHHRPGAVPQHPGRPLPRVLHHELALLLLLSFVAPSFRLRLLIHHAKGLRNTDAGGFFSAGGQMECYVNVKLGHNPIKATTIQPVPYDSANKPVVWNEPMDLDVRTADVALIAQVMDYDKGTNDKDDVVGTALIPMTEILESGEWATLQWRGILVKKFVPFTLLFENKKCGEIVISFVATPKGTKLPPSFHGLDPQDMEMGAE